MVISSITRQPSVSGSPHSETCAPPNPFSPVSGNIFGGISVSAQAISRGAHLTDFRHTTFLSGQTCINTSRNAHNIITMIASGRCPICSLFLYYIVSSMRRLPMIRQWMIWSRSGFCPSSGAEFSYGSGFPSARYRSYHSCLVSSKFSASNACFK